MSADVQIDDSGVITISGNIENLTLSGGIASGLGLTADTSYGTEIKSSVLTHVITSIATTATTLGELGLSGNNLKYSILDECGNAVVSNLTATTNQTIENWFNSMKAYGITGSISDTGVISIEGGIVSGNLATALGLGQVQSGTTISGTSAQSGALSSTVTIAATMTSKLSQFGVTSDKNLTIQVGGTTKSFTFNANSTVQDIANAFSSMGGSFSFEGNTIDMSGVDSVGGTLLTALGITGNGTDGTTTIKVSGVSYTIGGIATESSKLSDFITVANKTFNIYTTEGAALASNLTLASSATVGDLLSTIKSYGLDASLGEDGRISIHGGYITGGLADQLGISAVTTGSTVASTTAQSNALVSSITTTATMTSKLSQFGVTSNKNFTVQVGGTTKSYTFGANSTLQEVANAITSVGGSFSFENNVMNISGVDSISGTLLAAMGIAGTETGGTTTIQVNSVKYTIGGIATEASKFTDFGVTVSGKTFSVHTTDGNLLASGQTLAADATVGDLLSKLNAYGLNAYVDSSGRIDISNGYISGSLATALGITTSAYKTVVTEKTLVSTVLQANTSTTANLNTTLSQLGLSGTQYLTINYNGTTVVRNFTAASTLADIKDAIDTAGGSMELIDGYISTKYVELSGNLLTNLGLNKTQGEMTPVYTTITNITTETITVDAETGAIVGGGSSHNTGPVTVWRSNMEGYAFINTFTGQITSGLSDISSVVSAGGTLSNRTVLINDTDDLKLLNSLNISGTVKLVLNADIDGASLDSMYLTIKSDSALVLEGNGHVISNLDDALFDHVNFGSRNTEFTVQNLGFENVNVIGNGVLINRYIKDYYSGGGGAYLNINNCYIKNGTVTGNNNNQGVGGFLGGLGHLDGYSSWNVNWENVRADFNNSYVEDLSIKSDIQAVGGLIGGYNYGGYATNCYVIADLHSSNNSAQGLGSFTTCSRTYFEGDLNAGTNAVGIALSSNFYNCVVNNTDILLANPIGQSGTFTRCATNNQNAQNSALGIIYTENVNAAMVCEFAAIETILTNGTYVQTCVNITTYTLTHKTTYTVTSYSTATVLNTGGSSTTVNGLVTVTIPAAESTFMAAVTKVNTSGLTKLSVQKASYGTIITAGTYALTTLDDLKAIQGVSFQAGVTLVLANDINVNNGWSGSVVLNGSTSSGGLVIDGNGYAITNLNCALFQSTNCQLTVEDLLIKDSNIKWTNSYNAAAIVEYANWQVTIKNSSLTNCNIQGSNYTGGFVAVGGNTDFQNCKISNTTISGTSTSLNYIGGLVAKASVFNASSCIVQKTSLKGDTPYANADASFADLVGGLIGYLSGGNNVTSNISQCYIDADISNTSYGGMVIGNVYTSYSSTYNVNITNVFAKGNLDGNSDNGAIGTGVAGWSNYLTLKMSKVAIQFTGNAHNIAVGTNSTYTNCVTNSKFSIAPGFTYSETFNPGSYTNVYSAGYKVTTLQIGTHTIKTVVTQNTYTATIIDAGVRFVNTITTINTSGKATLANYVNSNGTVLIAGTYVLADSNDFAYLSGITWNCSASQLHFVLSGNITTSASIERFICTGATIHGNGYTLTNNSTSNYLFKEFACNVTDLVIQTTSINLIGTVTGNSTFDNCVVLGAGLIRKHESYTLTINNCSARVSRNGLSGAFVDISDGSAINLTNCYAELDDSTSNTYRSIGLLGSVACMGTLKNCYAKDGYLIVMNSYTSIISCGTNYRFYGNDMPINSAISDDANAFVTFTKCTTVLTNGSYTVATGWTQKTITATVPYGTAAIVTNTFFKTAQKLTLSSGGTVSSNTTLDDWGWYGATINVTTSSGTTKKYTLSYSKTFGDLVNLLNNSCGVSATLSNGTLSLTNTSGVKSISVYSDNSYGEALSISSQTQTIRTTYTSQQVYTLTVKASQFATFECYQTTSVNYTYVASITTHRTTETETTYSTSTETDFTGTTTYTAKNTTSSGSSGGGGGGGGGGSTYVDIIYSTVTITTSSSASFVYRSAQKTLGVTDTDFSANDTKLSQLGITAGTITVKNNATGTSSAISITASTTMADLMSALELKGFNATLDNGRLTLHTDQDLSVLAGTSNALTILGFQTATTTATYQQNSSSSALNNQVVTTVTTATTLGAFAPNTEKLLKINVNGTDYEKSFSDSNTINDVLNYLKGLGLTATLSNGTLTMSSTDQEFAISGALGDALIGANATITGGSRTSAWAATLADSVSTQAISGTTKIVTLGVTTGALKIYDNGNWINSAIYIEDDTTINDFISACAAYGITASLNSGKLTLTADSDKYITNESSDMVSKLGLTAKTNTYNTCKQNTDSKVLNNKSTITMTTSTTLNEFADSAAKRILEIEVNGTNYSKTFAATNTVNDVLEYLKGLGLTATLSSGTLTLSSSDQEFSISGSLGETLLGNNAVITSGTRTSAWTGTLADKVTSSTVTSATKLVTMGVTTGDIKVYDNGNWINGAIHIDENTTVADFLAACEDYGITAELNGDKIKLSADSDKYLANETSNLVSKLGLANKSQTTVATYEQTNSKALSISTTVTTSASTTLKELGFNDGATLRVVINGVQQALGFASNESVQDVIDTLESYGIQAEISNGKFSATSDVNTFSMTGALADVLMGNAATNVTTSATNFITSKELDTDVTTKADRDTKLVDLGVETGYVNILKDGNVTGSVSIDDNTTVQQFLRAISVYGINGRIDSDGKISLETVGNVSMRDATSDVVSVLGLAIDGYVCTYSGTTQILEDNVNEATRDTLLSELNQPGKECSGALYLKLTGQDGVENEVIINIDNNDSIGSLMQKLELHGLQTDFTNGILSFHNGFGSVEVIGGDSFVIENLGMVNRGLETWMQNDDKIEYYEEEVQTLSICNYVDTGTTLGSLGVSDGVFTLLYDGLGTKIEVNGNETIAELMSKITDKTGGKVTTRLTDDGRFVMEAVDQNIDLNVGTSTDTTNLASIFNLFKEDKFKIEGQTPLFKVSGSSKLTDAGIFRLGNVTEGTFTIGNAEFTITADTTLDSLVREINYSEEAAVSAFWDEINGKLVITSETMGASYINIQGGTSNFTDIFGLTMTSAGQEKLVTYNQTLGKNAILTINGAKIVSTSNTITSDISKIEGLTINIKDVTPGETVTISVEQDTQSIVDAVKQVVESYNSLVENLNDALAIDGELHNDIALKSIKNEITRLATGAGTNGTTLFRNLAAIGISTSKASSVLTTDIYSLSFDEEKFKKALNESEADVKLLLAGSITNPGILTKMEEIVENTLAASGYFASKTNSLNKQIASIDKKILRAEAQTAAYKSLLERKFQNMESIYSSMSNGYNNLFSLGSMM